MSIKNQINPGTILADLPELTQVKEIVIMYAYVYILVKQVRGHQYQYTSYYISFMQDIIQTINILPNLPLELDIMLLQPLKANTDNLQYQRQFQHNFRVCWQHILTQLYFLQVCHLDYYSIIISPDHVAALLVDRDMSLSIVDIIDNLLNLAGPATSPSDLVMTQSAVLSLAQEATEADLILKELIGCRPPITGVLALAVQFTPIKEASSKEQILTQVFPTLYLTGLADINMPRLQNITLKDYARHFICQHNKWFAQHIWWRFIVFNILICQKGCFIAQFYVLWVSHLKNFTHEELTEALEIDASILPQIIHYRAVIPGTCLFQRNYRANLQAHMQFLLQAIAPVFVTFSYIDIQWHNLQQYLLQFAKYVTSNNLTRQRIMQSNVQNYLYIIAHYLDIYFRTFLKHVLTLYLSIIDYQFCYKWQHHSSRYVHYLFWTKLAPLLDLQIDQEHTGFAEYQGQCIMAWNLDLSQLPDTCNLALLAPTNITNTPDQFVALLNHLQQHSTCSLSYYLQKKKGSNSIQCWFFYLWPLYTDLVVTKEVNEKSYIFALACNQLLLN